MTLATLQLLEASLQFLPEMPPLWTLGLWRCCRVQAMFVLRSPETFASLFGSSVSSWVSAVSACKMLSPEAVWWFGLLVSSVTACCRVEIWAAIASIASVMVSLSFSLASNISAAALQAAAFASSATSVTAELAASLAAVTAASTASAKSGVFCKDSPSGAASWFESSGRPLWLAWLGSEPADPDVVNLSIYSSTCSVWSL